MSIGQKILVFPSSMMESLHFSRAQKAQGATVYAASSVKADATAPYYDEWFYLPSIYDERFADDFAAAVERLKVTHFYTPHSVVYETVRRVVQGRGLALALAGEAPVDAMNKPFFEAMARAEAVQDFIRAIAPGCDLPPLAAASLLHYAGQIFGQTSEEKIAAMAAIFHSAPKGDVVEIGSAWGRSAFVLAFLARRGKVGPVLCIDPWRIESVLQADSPALLDEIAHRVDWEMVMRIFHLHMLSLGAGEFNYLRATSEQAHEIYRRSPVVTSEEYGATRYGQGIAVLHIDGNHDEACVRRDWELWGAHLQQGGWLILDDYHWEHGEGPRRVGDEILRLHGGRIDHCFTSGSALFARFGA